MQRARKIKYYLTTLCLPNNKYKCDVRFEMVCGEQKERDNTHTFKGATRGVVSLQKKILFSINKYQQKLLPAPVSQRAQQLVLFDEHLWWFSDEQGPKALQVLTDLIQGAQL